MRNPDNSFCILHLFHEYSSLTQSPYLFSHFKFSTTIAYPNIIFYLQILVFIQSI